MSDPKKSADDSTSTSAESAAESEHVEASRHAADERADAPRRDHAERDEPDRRHRRRHVTGQVNLRFFAISLLLAAAGSAGLFFAHRFQQKRMAGNILGRAEAVVNEDPPEARRLYGEYLHLQPDDTAIKVRPAPIQMEHAESV